MIANLLSRFEAALHIYLFPAKFRIGQHHRVVVGFLCIVLILLSGGLSAWAQDEDGSAAPTSKSDSGTETAVPSDLQGILTSGKVPESLDQLQSLEGQFARVSKAAIACTVSIRIGQSQGCGVIIDGEGTVLSAAHVVMQPGKKATVILSNGRRLAARTLGSNRNVDAGMLRIDPEQNDGKQWPHATMGTSKELKAGMWCIATGHPSGFDQERGPVTRVGRISGVNRSALRTDCALIGGDSGGPLFDLSGKLIAIHSRIGNDVEENLHIPIDNYRNSWERLEAGEFWGNLPGFRPVLGVQGNSQKSEAVIEEVRPNSAAMKAGFKVGDIVKEFGEQKITDFKSLKQAVSELYPGATVRVRVDRDGKPLFLRVVIGRGD